MIHMVKVVLKSFFCLLIVYFITVTTPPIFSPWRGWSAIAATTSPSEAPGQNVTVKGKVKLINVEGGCYQLITTDNTHYELQGEFPKQDGLIVKVKGTLATDLVTTCQVGRPLQVKNIQILRNH
jgi:hypothetical protein